MRDIQVVDVLEKRSEEILKLLADPTRRKILELIQTEPLNPQVIAKKLKISRPAVEKHLKLLVANYICERTVEPFPTPHYVYFVSNPGLEIMDAITKAIVVFFQAMDGIVNAELDILERDFVMGRVSRAEYDTRKPLLIKKQNELGELQLTKIWIEEARKVIKEYQDERD